MPQAPSAVTDRGDSAVGGEPVQLSSLVSRGLRFEWYEAIAVVQGVADLMRGAEAWESGVVPDADHIWLRSNGEMTVAPGTKKAGASGSVRALARLLLSLIDETHMPVQLRLVALSANSPAPPYANAEELSRAVAYFERPGRPAVIRDLYRRGRALPAESAAHGAVRAATPEPEKEKKKTPPPRRRRAVTFVAAAAVVVIAAGVAAWLFLGRPPLSELSSLGGRMSSSAARRFNAGKDSLVSNVTTAWRRLAGTEAQPEAAQAPASEPAQVTTPAGRRGTPKVGAGRSQGSNAAGAKAGTGSTVTELPIPGIPEFRAFDLAPEARPVPGNVPAAPGMVPSTRRLPAAAADEQLVVPTADFPGPVYTSADQEIVPPTPLRPKLPTVLPPGTRLDALSLMDLLISESGDVLSVRLVPPARDVREAMMLSAAKAWRFAPATKNGRAVRYLKRIWVIMSSSRSNPD
jgi:hypothetical protein